MLFQATSFAGDLKAVWADQGVTFRRKSPGVQGNHREGLACMQTHEWQRWDLQIKPFEDMKLVSKLMEDYKIRRPIINKKIHGFGSL